MGRILRKNRRSKSSRTRIILIILGIMFIAFHLRLHLSNPYAAVNFFKNPYSTFVADGNIYYHQDYQPIINSSFAADLLGYYKSGFLIAQNTLFGPDRIKADNPDEIISAIHKLRFDPEKPYLVSGDQFSVLYPRNLGVFYNQLLDPNTALDEEDWQNRQRIYLQSVLVAIDGLSAANPPRTTVVPIGPKSFTATEVHPGSIASDSVYGLLFAIDKLNTNGQSQDEKYKIQTQDAAFQILCEKRTQLTSIINNYIEAVQDKNTGLVKADAHLASARDGVIRSSSFYDNIVLWKTIQLADKYGLRHTGSSEIENLKNRIKQTYWDESQGIYKNALNDNSFSSDFLIGYPAGFFDLSDTQDLSRTKRIIDYIQKNKLAEPLPIKYQIADQAKSTPGVISRFVPDYGTNIIWSYWGSEYITLLANTYTANGDKQYLAEARRHIADYEKAIAETGGFPETFDQDGKFFRRGVYKSILLTGWVVQFEHAKFLVEN